MTSADLASGRAPAPEHREIIALLSEYARAIDAGDARAIARCLCAKDAETFIDRLYQVDLDDDVADVPEPSLHVSEIEIESGVARAAVTRLDRPGGGAYYFRLEENAWKICQDAEHDFT
jgi:hypothetical protein